MLYNNSSYRNHVDMSIFITTLIGPPCIYVPFLLSFFHLQLTFTIGKSFVDADILELRNKEIQVTPKWEGNKLVLTGPKGTNSATRELVGNQMVITFNWEGAVGKRFFNRA